ncbi:MAG TPA: tRNA-dihydrouridine synthase [Candidatus Paceibacterota bacterium]
MNSFWKSLERPFFVLAPMADVTDPAYRRLIAETAKPDVTWTEFVSADGLYHTREKKGMKDGTNPLVRDLAYTSKERPIVAQLFGSNSKTMTYAARYCAERGFDGIDLNMGCPDRSIEKQGAGAAMIKSIESAKAVVAAARESGLPVSVKTRIGYNSETIDEWISALLALELPALTVHLRTRKEMSLVPAHWELMPRIVALRDAISSGTLIIGNGDVKSIDDAKEKMATSGTDGAMLGRAIFGNPWVFSGRSPEEIAPVEKLDALLKLAHNFSELKPHKSFHLLKKHFKAFVVGWEGAAQLRTCLMETSSVEELTIELENYKKVTRP